MTENKDRRNAGLQYREKRYVRNGKTISGRLHDELVMMDLDKGKYFSLNPVATRIWDLLEKPFRMEELCTVLMEEYEVGEEQCLSEVRVLLEELEKEKLVEVVD